MHTFASVIQIERFAGNIPAEVTAQTVGPTIVAFTNGVSLGLPATDVANMTHAELGIK